MAATCRKKIFFCKSERLMCLPALASSRWSHVLYYLLVGLVLLVVGPVVLVEAARVLQVVCMFGTRGSMLTTVGVIDPSGSVSFQPYYFQSYSKWCDSPFKNCSWKQKLRKIPMWTRVAGTKPRGGGGGVPTPTYCATSVEVRS